MNIFKDIKEVLSSVTEEFKSNLRSKDKSVYKDLKVYLGPGSIKLLEKKHFQWSEIHDENLVLANKLKVVDGAINSLHSINSHNFSKIAQLEQELRNINSLTDQVTKLSNMCLTLKDSLVNLEEDMAVFESQLEYDQFEKYKQNLEKIVAVHQSEHNIKVELLKRKLAKLQSERLASKEQDLQKQLCERQKAFDEEYKQDLKEYLEKGRLERHEQDPQQIQNKENDGLEIDVGPTDQAKLDEFLN